MRKSISSSSIDKISVLVLTKLDWLSLSNSGLKGLGFIKEVLDTPIKVELLNGVLIKAAKIFKGFKKRVL